MLYVELKLFSNAKITVRAIQIVRQSKELGSVPLSAAESDYSIFDVFFFNFQEPLKTQSSAFFFTTFMKKDGVRSLATSKRCQRINGRFFCPPLWKKMIRI